jgi:glutamate dehydrogenase
VVGEGGNLGLTQRGRVEYAVQGGSVIGGVRNAGICTDFIDNSAGVDCSDHEVNIKILLNPLVTRGELAMDERDALLHEMTDEVGALVLRDNYEQAGALGNARAQIHPLLPVHRRLLAELERDGRLDRAIEAMPSDEELAERYANGTGLTAPELAVQLAYVKIALEDEINSSTLPDDAWTRQVLLDYFPTPLRDRYADVVSGHALRREIVTTQVVNEVVNRGGTTFVFRAVEETGASPADVIRAYVIVRNAYGLSDVWRAVEQLDNRVPTEAQTAVYLDVRRLLDRAVRWLVTNRRVPLDVTAETTRLGPGVARLVPDLDRLFRGKERDSLHRHGARLRGQDIPEDIAERVARIVYGFGLLDIVALADKTGRDTTEVAGVYYVLSERLQVDDLLSRISNLPRNDRWETLARMALRYDLYAALAALTSEVLASSSPNGTGEDRVTEWEQANAAAIARARTAIGELGEARAGLAPLSVLLRQIRTLVRTAGA